MNSNGDYFNEGDLVVYADGPTGLVKLESRHAGGWHAEHCLGGLIYVSAPLRKATVEDIQIAEDSIFYVFKRKYTKLVKTDKGSVVKKIKTKIVKQPKDTRPMCRFPVTFNKRLHTTIQATTLNGAKAKLVYMLSDYDDNRMLYPAELLEFGRDDNNDIQILSHMKNSVSERFEKPRVLSLLEAAKRVY